MKKIWRIVTAAVCTVCMTMSIAACSDNAVNAYDIAVSNGFVGTEEEWLLSLKGADGADGSSLKIQEMYEVAQANGYTGSIIDFMKEMGVNVQEDNDTDTIAANAMSVVNIYCGFARTSKSGYWGSTQTQYYSSAGSGVIIDLNKEAGNALIVTNYHVLYDAESDVKGISDNIFIYTYGAVNTFQPDPTVNYSDDGIRATYVGGAMDYDIALLKVEGSEYLKECAATEAKIGNSESVRLGEKVFAIGNPDGAGTAVTTGAISVESESIVMASIDGASSMQCRVMRTDAAINHGNSGGGLFNAAGELIGITNAKNVDSDVDNMGYALPITQVKYICDNILDNGVLKRAMLGVEVYTVTAMAKYDDNGRLQVYEEFAVATASKKPTDSSYGLLSEGDVFISMQINGGEKVTFNRQYQLNDLLLTVRKGDTVVLGIRNSEGVSENVTIVFNQDTHFVSYN